MPRKDGIRKSKLIDKPWEVTVDTLKVERDMGYGRLKDYNHGRKVELFWNVNEEAKEDLIFIMKIKGKQETITLYLDWEEIQRYLRWA